MGRTEFKGASFKAGMKLKVTGTVGHSARRFAVNVAHSYDNIAFHWNPRLYAKVVVMNSKHGGSWREEAQETYFPFEAGKEFEVTITFDKETFDVTLGDGYHTTFPNRFHDQKYKYIFADGDVHIKEISLRPN